MKLRRIATCLLAVGLAVPGAAVAQAVEGTPPLHVRSILDLDERLVSDDGVHAQLLRVVQQRQLNPLRAARLFSAVRVAQWLAADAAQGERATAGEQEAAAELAAFHTMAWILPQEHAEPWAIAALARAWRALGPGAEAAAFDRAQAHALAAAPRVYEYLLGDGADARRRPLPKPSWRPGLWARTEPLFAEQPTEPQAPLWRPWCAGSSTVDAPPPPEHGSARWSAELRDVRDVGSSLSVRERSAAQRWHLDAGSVTPPGVWNTVVLLHLQRHPLPALERARALALVNIAMQDALVAAWRVKLTRWTERPLTAIRRELDPSFSPLLVTPPFPGYVSGHAAVSGAAAGVLAKALPDAAADWASLAEEASMSRLWGGIHVRADNEAGLVLGHAVASACSRDLAGLLGDLRGPGGTPSDWMPLTRMSVTPR